MPTTRWGYSAHGEIGIETFRLTTEMVGRGIDNGLERKVVHHARDRLELLDLNPYPY